MSNTRKGSVLFAASTPDGVLRLNCELNMELREFEQWPTANVVAFFNGLAQVITAERAAPHPETRP